MTQVETKTTVSVDEALDAISDAPKAVLLTRDGEEVFIRVAADEDHRDGFLVNTHIDVINDRRTFTVEDDSTIRDAITGADTAEIVRINDSPWSPLYDE